MQNVDVLKAQLLNFGLFCVSSAEFHWQLPNTHSIGNYLFKNHLEKYLTQSVKLNSKLKALLSCFIAKHESHNDGT